jgi:DNA-binding XRE family transcriptional regulator
MQIFSFKLKPKSIAEKTYKLSDLINVDLDEFDYSKKYGHKYEKLEKQLKELLSQKLKRKNKNIYEFISDLYDDLTISILSVYKTNYRILLSAYQKSKYRDVDHRFLHLKLDEDDNIILTLNNDPNNQLEKLVKEKIHFEVENLFNKLDYLEMMDIYLNHGVKYFIKNKSKFISNNFINTDLDFLDSLLEDDLLLKELSKIVNYTHKAFIDEISESIRLAFKGDDTTITIKDLERLMGLRSSFTETETEPWYISDLSDIVDIASGKSIFKSTEALFHFESFTEGIYSTSPSVEENPNKNYSTKISLKNKKVINYAYGKLEEQANHTSVELALVNLVLAVLIKKKPSNIEAIKLKASKFIKDIWMRQQTNKTNEYKIKRLYYILKILKNIRVSISNINGIDDIKNSKLWDIQFEYLGDLKLNNLKLENGKAKPIEDLFDDFYFCFQPGKWKDISLGGKYNRSQFTKISKDIFYLPYINNRFYFRTLYYLTFLHRIDKNKKIKVYKLLKKVADFSSLDKIEAGDRHKIYYALKNLFKALKKLKKEEWEIIIPNSRFTVNLNDFNNKIDRSDFSVVDIKFSKQSYIEFTPPPKLRYRISKSKSGSKKTKDITDEFRKKVINYRAENNTTQEDFAGQVGKINQSEVSEIENGLNEISEDKYNAIEKVITEN